MEDKNSILGSIYNDFFGPGSLKNNKETVKKFLTATYKALKYVKTANPSEVAEYLAKHFTTTSKASCEASLKNYLASDTWVDNMAMTETAFNNLLNVIKNAGESVEGVTYLDVVDGTLANEIYNQLK